MNIWSKLLLLSGKRKYTLTVGTSPTNATCQMTIDGVTTETKSIKVEEGTYVTVAVSYSGTTTKTYSLTVERDTTLNFTRTYSTSTTFNNNLIKIGSPSLNTTTGVASGFSAGNALSFPDTINSNNTENRVPFRIVTKITTGSTFPTAESNQQNIFCFMNYNASSTFYGILLGIGPNGVLRFTCGGGSSNGIGATTPALSTNTTYYLECDWGYTVPVTSSSGLGISKPTIKYGTSQSNMTTVTASANSGTSWSNSTIMTAIIGGRKSTNNTTTVFPFLGAIDLKNTQVYNNGSLWWNGSQTAYNYYFNVSTSYN